MKFRFLTAVTLIGCATTVLAVDNIKPAAASSLKVETNEPDRNFFAIGSKVELKVSSSDGKALTDYAIEVYDFTRTNLVASIKGGPKFLLPSDRYGVYYVKASEGYEQFPKIGTLPTGYITYGVLEDPAKMPDLDPWDAFLGEHGCNFSWLWQRGGLGDARKPSDTRLVIWNTHRVAGAGKLGKDFWKIGKDPAIADRYRDNLTKVAKAAIAAGAGRQGRRIYENLWEPNLVATADEILAAQKVAWETLHELDPEALIGAYTSSGIDLKFMRTLMDKGLGNYMNALCVHPYKGIPELNGFLDDVRGLRRMIREYMGRDLPMFGTEAGMNEFNTIDGERRKLMGQLRQNLILLGEGFQMNCPFYGCDFGADLNNQGEGDYGLNYNLQYPKVRFGVTKSAPRPVFGALAAFGRLTEGHWPTCVIEYLGETVLGYAFTNRKDTDTVIALWDWGERNSVVRLPVGRDEVRIADVFGNLRKEKTVNGELTIALSVFPQYILDADVKIWGKEAQKKLKWSDRKFKSANELAPVGVVDFAPAFKGEIPGVAVKLENRTEREQKANVQVRIPGYPECRKQLDIMLKKSEEKTVEFISRVSFPIRWKCSTPK